MRPGIAGDRPNPGASARSLYIIDHEFSGIIFMSNKKNISEHYTHGNLLEAIQSSIANLDKTVDNLTIEDLAPVDEFHIGGRQATEHFLGQLNVSEQDHLLDVGCGLGGASRFVANKYHNHVTGIDLTPEYIETGKKLSLWVGLDKQVTLRLGSALSMPFDDEIFDGGFMMHVGMNIENKTQLFTEVFRVLRPNTSFGVYDIMKVDDMIVI
jgi:cyclopropane fatty-acyl-phospholipid synthase-like methyltransferase